MEDSHNECGWFYLIVVILGTLAIGMLTFFLFWIFAAVWVPSGLGFTLDHSDIVLIRIEATLLVLPFGVLGCFFEYILVKAIIDMLRDLRKTPNSRERDDNITRGMNVNE